MKNFVLRFGRGMLNALVFLAFLGIIIGTIICFVNNQTFFGFIILVLGFIGIVTTCFLLYLLIDINDRLYVVNETLNNLLLIVNNHSYSFNGIKEDTGVINSLLTDNLKIFADMNNNLISINNLLSQSSKASDNNLQKTDSKQPSQNLSNDKNIESAVTCNPNNK